MEQEGLLFPKSQGKKKERKHHPPSIIPGDNRKICYMCGCWKNIEEHHIFFGKGRKDKSEEYGLKVHLCMECHRTGKRAVHKCEETNLYFKRIAQRAFENQIGSREDFIKLIGKNYL